MSGNPMWRCPKCQEWVSAPTGSMLDAAIETHERMEAELADVRQERDKISTSSYHLIESWKEQLNTMEAELAEVTQRYRDAERRWDEQYAAISDELAEWEIHGVRVTEDCETCDGSGELPPVTLGRSRNGWTDCPDCGGTGKKPRDGVFREFDEGPDGEWRDYYVIPAERLEAE